MDSTITVGITGGIGAGKSIISRTLSIMGYPVFYSDNQAKEILQSDPETKHEVVRLFGEAAYHNGQYNVKHVASKVFEDSSLRDKLNNVVHPKVRLNFQNFTELNSGQVVFNEAAILFETEAYKKFNYNLLVVAPIDLRVKRVQRRDGLTQEEIMHRINSQWSDEKKSSLADFVLINDDKQAVLPQLYSILNQLKNESANIL